MVRRSILFFLPALEVSEKSHLSRPGFNCVTQKWREEKRTLSLPLFGLLPKKRRFGCLVDSCPFGEMGLDQTFFVVSEEAVVAIHEWKTFPWLDTSSPPSLSLFVAACLSAPSFWVLPPHSPLFVQFCLL